MASTFFQEPRFPCFNSDFHKQFNVIVSTNAYTSFQKIKFFPLLQDELKALLPGVSLDDQNLSVMTDEIAQFILYSFMNVQYFQKELAKLEVKVSKDEMKVLLIVALFCHVCVFNFIYVIKILYTAIDFCS